MNFEIDGRKIGPGNPPYIIAELSGNHNGSIQKALDTIRMAKACGADAIKLQTYTAETMTIDCDREEFMVRGGLWDGSKLFDLYRSAETPFDWQRQLFEFARSIGITVFSTPFDETAVELLESLDCPAYKIASFELTDLTLIRRVAETGKPMIMSTGMATEAEIDEAVAVANEFGSGQLALLHCISSYPAPISQSNLLRIPGIKQRFDVVVGLSDHTLGTTVSIASVALGAALIEKHFILDRADKGPDSEFSIMPDELTQLCRESKDVWSALGDGSLVRPACEDDSRVFRRSLVFVRDLAAGAVITPQDIRRIRPGYGLPPKYFDSLIGRKMKCAVARGTPVTWDCIDE